MYLIKNANRISMAEINYKIKDILIENGKIAKIGKLDPRDYPNAKVIDADKNFVTPGIVDPHCHIGLYEEAIGFEGADGNEATSPITPELRAIDAVKPQDVAFQESLASGITTVCTGPGSANLIGGTFCVMKTYGKTIDDMILVEESSMKMALGENPKRVYGNRTQSPSTRMGSAALIREALTKAKEYKQKFDEYEKGVQENKDVKKPDFNAKNHALARVFAGLPVKIHAHQQDDIVTAIRIIEEFGLKATIEHATEGHLIADYLKQHNQSVIIGPTLGSKSKYELRNKSFETVPSLVRAGVLVSITTDHNVHPQESLILFAAMAVKAGLSKADALRCVTLNPAKILGIAEQKGDLRPGMDADLVLWNLDPLDIQSRVVSVLVRGKRVL